MVRDPNPQPLRFSAYEAPIPTVYMTPQQSVAGWTLQLNVRRLDGALALQTTNVVVYDVTIGVFGFPLTAPQTGVTLGPGDFEYDVWRIDAGAERRLTYGPLTVLQQQRL